MKLAVACSGGADSLALAVLAAADYDVTALIVDHGLRKESKKEAEKTAKILKVLSIKHVILRPKPLKITSNVQGKARKMRYKLMTDYCKKHKIKQLATAHHADDNAETVLLRISRGSGVDGLSGIPEITEMDGILIIRPLLNSTKQQLVDFLKDNKIKWVEDPTNKTDKYKRNQLRHALDLLEDKNLISQRLNDLSNNMKRVRDYLESETANAEAAIVKYGKTSAEIDQKKFANLHDEIAFRLLLSVIDTVGKPKERPRFENLKNLKAAILDNQVRTLAGLIFRPKNKKILVAIEK